MTSPETLDGTFIEIDLDESIRSDRDLAAKLEEVCPVDIFAAGESGVEIVRANLDECVLCNLCVDAAPENTLRVIKKYEE